MKKTIRFILNNWAMLWALILLTILVFYVSQACDTISSSSIGIDGGITIDGTVSIIE